MKKCRHQHQNYASKDGEHQFCSRCAARVAPYIVLVDIRATLPTGEALQR